MQNPRRLTIVLALAVVLVAVALVTGPATVHAAATASKSCTGTQNPDQTVSPGQRDVCTLFTSIPLATGSEITVTVTSPTGAAVITCQGLITTSYATQPEAGLLTTFCPFKVVSGSVQPGEQVGLETITIPATSALGTAVDQEAFICPTGGFTSSCPGVLGGGPGSVIVCGPGSVVGQPGPACPGSVPTPTGTNVVVSVGPVTVTFATVARAGDTAVATSTAGPPAPTGYFIVAGATYYTVGTTAAFDTAVVCITDPSITATSVLLHYNPPLNGMPVTDPNYPMGTTICSIPLASLSPFVIAEPVTTTPVITWATPADITYPTALSQTQLNATASVAGTFTYNPPAGTVLAAGAGQTLTATFTPTSPSYNTVSTTRLLNVLQATQVITFGPLADKTFGAPDFTVAATTSSGLTVSFAATGACTVSGTTVHITGVGSCTITASQAGGANYNAATPVAQTFSIAAAGTTITEHVTGVETSFPTSCSGGSLSTFIGLASGPLTGFWSAAICHTPLDKSASILGGTFVVQSKTTTVRGSFTGGSVIFASEIDSFGLCIQTFRVSGTLTDGTFNAVLTHYGVRTASGCRVFFATISGTATLTF